MLEPICYREVGSGPPLLLVHGDFSDGPGAWSLQLESLSGHHRLIVVDRRGHGRSPREPRPYTIAGDATDVLAVADQAGADRFHLAGHSYGGLVAIEVARRAADRVRSLHLLEPPYLMLLPRHPAVAPLIARGREIRRMASAWGPEQTAEAFFAMIAGDAGLARLRASQGWTMVVREAGRFAETEFATEYPRAEIGDLRLKSPVRVYAGGQSHPGLYALAHRLAEVIPGAGLVILPAATHAVQRAGRPFDLALLAVAADR
jgi:pimeloyl-ACP methyl ester carboxylesterase